MMLFLRQLRFCLSEIKFTRVTLSRMQGFSWYGVPILFSLFFEGHSHVIPENRLKSNKASGTLLFVSGIWGAESLFWGFEGCRLFPAVDFAVHYRLRGFATWQRSKNRPGTAPSSS